MIVNAPWAPCDRCGWMPASCTCSPDVGRVSEAPCPPHCRCKQCTADRRWAEAEAAERKRIRALWKWRRVA